jgi:predicted AlkP superfamily phosphohydrolase/phosphomutase
MRYLRMLSNSFAGGAIGAAYIVVLVLQLNPELSLRPANLGPLYLALGLTYGLSLAVAFYVLIVLRQLVATEVDSPRWVSFGLLTWLSTVSASGASALMWLNLGTFGPMLLADTAHRMTTGAGWMTACAAVFLVLALVHYSFGRRGSRVASALSVLTLVASLSLPLVARGFGIQGVPAGRASEVNVGLPASPPFRVVIVALDGASLNFIDIAAAEGRLPNFGKILDGGASMHLATIRPTQPGPVWTAVATGKLPTRNGVRSAARYRASGGEAFEVLPDYCFSHALVRSGIVTEEPHNASALRALPLWDILSRLGISVGVVGWPLSHPVHALSGYMVSDQLHTITDLAVDEEEALVRPREAAAITKSVLETMPSETATWTRTPSGTVAQGDQAAIERQLFEIDAMYEKVSNELQAWSQPRVVVVRYRGLDAAGHYYLRYADPRPFGDVTAEERRAFGQVLPSAYSIVDAAIGRVLASLGPDDLLLVVSGFGMEPLGVGKRLLERAFGNPQLSGTHENAPDGFLLAYGAAVEPGRRSRASVVDVVPTVLYFFGLPIARDMEDGHARTDIFRRSFAEPRPITFIPTYER